MDRVLALFRALHERGAAYVLVGGVAVNLHGIARATEDVDLFVRSDEANVARIRAALRDVWDDPDIEQIRADDLAGEYPVVRYGPPDEDFVVDLMARLGESVSYGDLEHDEIVVDGVPVTIATPRALYRMKRDTVRPVDRADAATLREKFGLED